MTHLDARQGLNSTLLSGIKLLLHKLVLMVTFSREEVEVSDPDRASSVCPGGGEASTQTYAGDHFLYMQVTTLFFSS